MTNITGIAPDATPDLSEAMLSLPHWGVAGLTLLLVGITVGMHYEALERLNFWLPKWGMRARPRVLMLIVSILAVHTAEVWVFGLGIHLMVQQAGFGWISGVSGVHLLDAVYLSAVTFTTVGYGDLLPHGPIRFALGSEALTGAVLMTWSASFTFLEMRRFWRR